MRQWIRLTFVAALLASAPVASRAAPLLNPGFETGDLTGWNTSGNVTVANCGFGVIACAPGGGSKYARLNSFSVNPGVGTSTLTQAVTVDGPGTYEFGAKVVVGTNNAAGNFAQNQISLQVQGTSNSATVGNDPNALNGQFVIGGSGGFSFTEWFDLKGTLVHAGGTASFLLNINVQNGTADNAIVAIVDNAYIISAVPLPAGAILLLSALAGLRLAGRRHPA